MPAELISLPQSNQQQLLLGSEVNSWVEDQVGQFGTAAGTWARGGIEKNVMYISHKHNNSKIWCTKYKTLLTCTTEPCSFSQWRQWELL